jgi:hypothetical protein
MNHDLRTRLRYRFDNWMAKGVVAQILLLAAATVVLIALTVAALAVYGGIPTDGGAERSPGRLAWFALMHVLDAGSVAGDTGAWLYLIIMLATTFGGIFIFSALIGVLNTGFTDIVEGLRRGRSPALEQGHTVVLGWSDKIHTLLDELAKAGANQADPCVVVLADRDKVEMDEELRGSDRGKLRVVTRRGNPMSVADLELVSLPHSKAVVILPPDGCDATLADAVSLKTLLAIGKAAHDHRPHVVAELQDVGTEQVARIVTGSDAALVVAPPLISRLLVQTGRQSGLSTVYADLLDFDGVEFYVQSDPAFVGQTFRQLVFAYEDSTVVGLLDAHDVVVLAPPEDHVMKAGERIVALSEDDDTVVRNARPVAYDPTVLVDAPSRVEAVAERTLILGASPRLSSVLGELDGYVASGSETVVVGSAPWIDADDHSAGNMKVVRRAGDITSRSLLDGLDVPSFDHVLVLSETEGQSAEIADARTMITLLHLRDIAAKAGKKVPITSEILQIENRELASVAEADDFIVSNTLVSLLVAQVAENRHLTKLFDELFSSGGYEVYLKPATDYVQPGVEVPFAAIVEAGLRRREVAIGLRRAAHAKDERQAYGVVLNPKKSQTFTLAPGDTVITLADQ